MDYDQDDAAQQYLEQQWEQWEEDFPHWLEQQSHPKNHEDFIVAN